MNMDSEMEEGEIVDDLSDISSEEEFLLRQRLEVLENYNNVLERKKAKRTSVGPGTKHKKEDALSYDLSEISATDLEDYCSPYRNIKIQKHQKTHHRQKRKKEEPNVVFVKSKEHKKKNSRAKKKPEVKVVSESSDESEDEYKNRRKKLAEAVVVNKPNHDKTSLSERLQKMLCGVNPEPNKLIQTENKTDHHITSKMESLPNCSPISSQSNFDQIINSETQNGIQGPKTPCEVIDICTDEDSKAAMPSVDSVDTVIIDQIEQTDNINKILDRGKTSDKDSDDDLELLRQHALKTKKVPDGDGKRPFNKIMSDDEDSDTTELRLICLKSAILKKAIEMKRKQKLQKRLSQSSNLHDDGFDQFLAADKINYDNNTDIESVDMDIGSDGDDKLKENDSNCAKNSAIEQQVTGDKHIPVLMVTNEDELEEDEDLLRAKLLTSLSKNLPNLVNPNIIKSIEGIKDSGRIKVTKAATKAAPKPKQLQPSSVIPEEKRFIISVESDSEGEHEATKNLTKMHMKLSEQIDFQQKLDLFLKSTRMEVEKTTLPDVVLQPAPQKKPEKYVVKAVKNLPKSEQIEYKHLVKRMAELEKIKQVRQTIMNLSSKLTAPTLKPRNVTIDASNLTAINSLEEKIKNSRKNIAEESAKMLKLKEEGTKLSQRFKIVATELRNIKTAIALNKKQQRSVQNCLAKIRLHHQMLLKSSLTSTHSNANTISHLNHVTPKLQKENNPEEQKLPMILKEIPKENYKNITLKDIPKENKEIPKVNKVIPKTNKEIPKVNNEIPKAYKEIPKAYKEITKENNKNMIHKEIPKDNHKNAMLKAVKISITNDLNIAQHTQQPIIEKSKPLVLQHPRLSIEIDVTNNTKIVTMPQEEGKEKSKENKNVVLHENKRQSTHPVVEKGGGKDIALRVTKRKNSDDCGGTKDIALHVTKRKNSSDCGKTQETALSVTKRNDSIDCEGAKEIALRVTERKNSVNCDGAKEIALTQRKDSVDCEAAKEIALRITNRKYSVDYEGAKEIALRVTKRRDTDDYKSPLDAFGSTTWEEDPNAILCPFEVCGDCKDADCKYLHTKTRSK